MWKFDRQPLTAKTDLRVRELMRDKPDLDRLPANGDVCTLAVYLKAARLHQQAAADILVTLLDYQAFPARHLHQRSRQR